MAQLQLNTFTQSMHVYSRLAGPRTSPRPSANQTHLVWANCARPCKVSLVRRKPRQWNFLEYFTMKWHNINLVNINLVDMNSQYRLTDFTYLRTI